MPGTLEGKVVVVTGSATGIGRAVAVGAAERGARVVVNSRKAERMGPVVQEIERLGAEVLRCPADLRNPEQVDAMVQAVRERFGRVDIWVSNAGGMFRAPAEEISPNGWRSVVETNLTTAFLCARAVFPIMKAQGGGRIVNVASVAAYEAYPGGAHYAASKAAVVSLTGTLAAEWARHGVQVNCVAPGAVLTEASSFADLEVRRQVEASLPAGRVGQPEEIAEVILFLAESRGGYLNGETIRVDGARRTGLVGLP